MPYYQSLLYRSNVGAVLHTAVKGLLLIPGSLITASFSVDSFTGVSFGAAFTVVPAAAYAAVNALFTADLRRFCCLW